jgi:sRNA-binding regulator protein Hfq
MGSLRIPAGYKGAEHNGMSKAKTKAPEQTYEEVKYLRYLIDNAIPVRARLSSNEEVEGLVEFYDAHFVRLTRRDGPNLFLFKHDIKYLYEVPNAGAGGGKR